MNKKMNRFFVPVLSILALTFFAGCDLTNQEQGNKSAVPVESEQQEDQVEQGNETQNTEEETESKPAAQASASTPREAEFRAEVPGEPTDELAKSLVVKEANSETPQAEPEEDTSEEENSDSPDTALPAEETESTTSTPTMEEQQVEQADEENEQTIAPDPTPAAPEQPLSATPSAYETELLRLINEYRAENGLPAWIFSANLNLLATEQSQAMLDAGVLSHDNFQDRFNRSGRLTCAENVGWNYKTAQAQFDGWKGSSGHNANMRKENLTSAGISRVGAYVTLFACS